MPSVFSNTEDWQSALFKTQVVSNSFMRAFFTYSSLTPPVFFFIWESPSPPTQVFKVSEVILASPFPLQAPHQPHTNSTFSLDPQAAYVPPFPWQPLWCQPLELPHLHHCKPVFLPPLLEGSLYAAAGTWNKIQCLSLYNVKSSHAFPHWEHPGSSIARTPNPTWEPSLTSSSATTVPYLLANSPGEPSGQDSLLGILPTWHPLLAPSSPSAPVHMSSPPRSLPWTHSIPSYHIILLY